MKALIILFAAGSLFAQKPTFTEDFESGKIDPTKWEAKTQGTATLAVEPVEGAHGKYALHIHYPEMATGSFALLVAPHIPESLKTHFFGRAWVKVTPELNTSHTVLVFGGEPGWPISKFDEIGVYKGTFQPSYQENKSARGQGRGEAVAHGEAPFPQDKWFLLEWEFNDAPNSITLWVDGQRQVSAGDQKKDTFAFVWPKGSETVNNLVGGYQELGIGARVWGAPPKSFEVFYDDIAIGPERLGGK